MRLGDDTLEMCRLVAFAVAEKGRASENKLSPGAYAKGVLGRFRELYPDAVLVQGDLVVGGAEWQKMLSKDCVQCGLDGTWQFRSARSCMAVAVRTDGSVHLDHATAEVMFGLPVD